jgi:hypothetical protein
MIPQAPLQSYNGRGSCDDVGDPTDPNGKCTCNGVRTLAANSLAQYLDTDPTNTCCPKKLIIGDLNSYAKEDPSKLTLPVMYGVGRGPVTLTLTHLLLVPDRPQPAYCNVVWTTRRSRFATRRVIIRFALPSESAFLSHCFNYGDTSGPCE